MLGARSGELKENPLPLRIATTDEPSVDGAVAEELKFCLFASLYSWQVAVANKLIGGVGCPLGPQIMTGNFANRAVVGW